MGKLVEVVCPHCKQIRIIQKKNQYASTTIACKLCTRVIAKQYFKAIMARKKDYV